jgi:hypothetical protein
MHLKRQVEPNYENKDLQVMLPTPDEQTDSLSLENLSPRNFDTKHNNQFCLHFKRGKRPELKQSN